MYSFAQSGDSQIYLHKPSGKCLIVERGVISSEAQVPSVYKHLAFDGIGCIIGMIKLKINNYMIICDKYEIAGDINGHEVGLVTGYDILPLNNRKSDSEELEYLKLLREHLNKNKLYFSVDNQLDLTNNCQTQYSSKNGASYNKEFWWNNYLCENLIEEKVDHDFISPIINGYFKSSPVSFTGNYHFNYTLLTRKSSNRAGTRYFKRGIDDEGNVANFNETEQIIVTSTGQLLSFLQIRGSVPIYWSEVNNLRYKPNLIVSSRNALDATTKHFTKAVTNYGDIYCINLVNQKGYELPVKQGFESMIDVLPSTIKKAVNYIYFDFHHECKNMKFENVNKLISRIQELGFDNDNYFHYDLNKGEVINLQNKVIRSNCMDCLDRTNVVQSMFSRWILQKQLSVLNFIDIAIPWRQLDKNFNFIFQNFWADNADAVSKSYSSTPALKTDFTRLGKRTLKGNLSDLNNSIVRYYNNNLRDGVRQDSYDLFLGKYRPFEHSPTQNPFIDYRPQFVQLLPYLLTTSFIILFSLVFYPKGPLSSIKNILAVLACVSFQYGSVTYMLKNPYQYVNWPLLVNLDFLIKSRVTDSAGNPIGVQYDHHKDFKIQSKKSN